MLKEMLSSDIAGIYDALGETVTVVISGMMSDIKVIPEDDLLVEYAEYDMYRAIASQVNMIDAGDALIIDGKVYTVHNVKPTDDGLEKLIGVRHD